MDAMWMMIMVVAGVGTSIPVLAIWVKHRQRIAELEVEKAAHHGSKQVAAYADENHELKSRVAVLERIVTDKGYSVADQIEALRDIPASSDSDSGVPLASGKRETV